MRASFTRLDLRWGCLLVWSELQLGAKDKVPLARDCFCGALGGLALVTSRSDVRTFILLIISALFGWSYPFACLVLRAVAATAIFVALVAGALAGQKDARNERPYIFLADF